MMPAHYAEKHSADAMPRSASELAGVEISEAEVRGVMAKVTGKRIVHPASPAPAADADAAVVDRRTCTDLFAARAGNLTCTNNLSQGRHRPRPKEKKCQ